MTYPTTQALPAGETADKSALFGLIALQSNTNALLAEGLATVPGDTTVTATLTVDNVMQKNIVITTGAITGGFVIQLPATSAIISALGPTVPVDGTAFFALYISNQGTGQTGTLTAGDANTTVSSTENTLATNVSGKWMVQVATATTLVVTRVFAGDA